MALVKTRNRWVDRAGLLVLFVVVLTPVLVLLGDSFGHATWYSLGFGAVMTVLEWWHSRRRDVRRRRQQPAIDV